MKPSWVHRDQANRLHPIVYMEMRGCLCIVVRVQRSVLVMVMVQVLGTTGSRLTTLRSQSRATGVSRYDLPHHGKHQQEERKTRSHGDGFTGSSLLPECAAAV